MIALDRRGFLAGTAVLAAVPRAFAQEAADDQLLARAKRALAWHTGSIPLRDRIAMVDFGRHSREARLEIVDLVAGWRRSFLCAHGKGSDPAHTGWLQRFSNEINSNATSAGAYITGDIYEGTHGQSMRLRGLDPGNTNAEDRAIVFHSAPYVGPEQLATWGKLGRSDGCFVVDPAMLAEVLALIGPRRLLYADRIGAGGPVAAGSGGGT